MREKQSERQKTIEQGFSKLVILVSAGVTALIALAAVLRMLRPEPESTEPQTVILETGEDTPADIVDFIVEPTPSPTPVIVAPAGAVTLLVDREPLMTLMGRNEAENLLNAYLRASAVPPEGETLVSAAFTNELLIVDAARNASPTDYHDALKHLLDTPTLIPVRLVTVRTETETGAFNTETSELAELAKGMRMVTQLGAGGIRETTREITYLAGQEVSQENETVTTLREARPTIIRTGTYTKRNTGGEPDKDEGPEGKPKGELKLAYPMRGSMKSYFGFRDGKFHAGIDIENQPGTSVSAPAEGVVTYCGKRGAYGFTVDIDHGNGFLSRLTHLAGVELSLGQRVFKGDAVGTLAENGDEADRSKPHLHYELHIDGVPYNPMFYIG